MKQIHKRVATLLFAAALTGLLASASLLSPPGSQVVWAKGGEAETETVPNEQETGPVQTESDTVEEQPEVKITIEVPEGWQSDKASGRCKKYRCFFSGKSRSQGFGKRAVAGCDTKHGGGDSDKYQRLCAGNGPEWADL